MMSKYAWSNTRAEWLRRPLHVTEKHKSHAASSPYHPQSNGCAEAAVKVLKALVIKTGNNIKDRLLDSIEESPLRD